MLSKHKVSTLMSGLLAVTRGFVAAFLLMARSCSSGSRLARMPRRDAQFSHPPSVGPNARTTHPGVPEIAVGAGIAPSCWPVAACCCWPTVSAGRRSRSPDLRFSGRRSCVEREWVGSQDGAKIGIATGGEIVHCIVSPPMIEPFERGPG